MPVDVFEQGALVGGKMNRVRFDGCTFDTGPSLLTMPFILEDFFENMGTTLSQELQLVRVEPACQYRWADGTILDIPQDIEGVAEAIATISRHDAENIPQYFADAKQMYESTKRVFLFSAFDGVSEFFKPKNFNLIPKLPSLRFSQTLDKANRQYFSHPKIIQLFNRFATYNGSSPYKSPATLMIIPWVEFGYGAWYPMGGMYSVAEAILRVAVQAGVRVHTHTPVKKIITSNKKATGIQTVAGDVFSASHVISNVDVYITNSTLLGQNISEPPSASSSAVVLLMSVKKEDFGLAHHTVLFSDDYPTEFSQLFETYEPLTNPTVYIARSCSTDPSQGTDELENWFVMVNAPATGDGRWQEGSEEYAQMIIKQLALFGITPTIQSMVVRTPDSMAKEWGSDRGSIYGISSNSMFTAFLRQQQRSQNIQNLWYVGGSAHPGGGVPLVITSGTIAANLILT